jgi:predicted enzyme related to lactoylglutathione lyase
MGDLMANLQDPSGAKFSIWEKKTATGPTRLNDLGALCWTELYTLDPGPVAKFYTSLLGWKTEMFPNSPMPYTIFAPPSIGRGVGGMLKITAEMSGMTPQWLPYFSVKNTDETADRAGQLGGKADVLKDIPTIGRIAIMTDAEGAAFAIITPQCSEQK